jgi:hypothetical protein
MKTAFVLACSLAASAFPQNTGSGPCDRACLESFADQYMDALIAHDPKRLPLSAKLKNTENGQRLDPGDGFWRTAAAKGKYRLFVDDPHSGDVALMTTMTEATVPVSVAIRLKIENRQIAEIETFVVRTGLSTGNGAAELEKLGSPNPVLLETIPAAERASREELIKTANLYFAGLEKNDGKGNYSFFTDDCERLEDGQQTTHNPNFRTGSSFTAGQGGRGGRGGATGGGEKQAAPPTGFNPAALGCKEQFQSGYFRFVTRIRDRRFVAVDTERGLVFSFVFFDHAAGRYRNYAMADGTGTSNGPARPWTWDLAEVFKIEKGKIRRVEALLDQVPYGMLSGWSTWEEGMSSKPR